MSAHMWLAQWLLAALLLSCLLSFGWAMKNFFTKPDRMTLGMKLTTFTGVAFSILHFVLLLTSSSVTVLTAAIAACLYLGSLALFWWTIQANRAKPLSACFSRSERLHLVQHGPYRFVRHPFYLSYLLAWLGGAAATQSIYLAITVAVMLGIYISAANKEERRFSESAHAAEYRAYRDRTGQFLPLPWKFFRVKQDDPARFTSGVTERPHHLR